MRSYHLTESELALGENITTEEWCRIYQASEVIYTRGYGLTTTGAQGVVRQPASGGEGAAEGAFNNSIRVEEA